MPDIDSIAAYRPRCVPNSDVRFPPLISPKQPPHGPIAAYDRTDAERPQRTEARIALKLPLLDEALMGCFVTGVRRITQHLCLLAGTLPLPPLCPDSTSISGLRTKKTCGSTMVTKSARSRS